MLKAHLELLPHTLNKLEGPSLYDIIVTIFDEYQIVYFLELGKDTELGGNNKRSEIMLGDRTKHVRFHDISQGWYKVVKELLRPFYNELVRQKAAIANDAKAKADKKDYGFDDYSEDAQLIKQHAEAGVDALDLYDFARDRMMKFANMWAMARDIYSGTSKHGPITDAPHCNSCNNLIFKDVKSKKKS